MKFYKAYNYLNNHLMFKNHFQQCLDIEVVKVNPKNLTIDNKSKKNTKTQVWLECGPYLEDCLTHDINLDCGASTFEKAIIKLAKKVKKQYSDDEFLIEEKILNLYKN